MLGSVQWLAPRSRIAARKAPHRQIWCSKGSHKQIWWQWFVQWSNGRSHGWSQKQNCCPKGSHKQLSLSLSLFSSLSSLIKRDKIEEKRREEKRKEEKRRECHNQPTPLHRLGTAPGLLLAWSNGRSNGPMVGPMVGPSVQWSVHWMESLGGLVQYSLLLSLSHSLSLSLSLSLSSIFL